MDHTDLWGSAYTRPLCEVCESLSPGPRSSGKLLLGDMRAGCVSCGHHLRSTGQTGHRRKPLQFRETAEPVWRLFSSCCRPKGPLYATLQRTLTKVRSVRGGYAIIQKRGWDTDWDHEEEQGKKEKITCISKKAHPGRRAAQTHTDTHWRFSSVRKNQAMPELYHEVIVFLCELSKLYQSHTHADVPLLIAHPDVLLHSW